MDIDELTEFIGDFAEKHDVFWDGDAGARALAEAIITRFGLDE